MVYALCGFGCFFSAVSGFVLHLNHLLYLLSATCDHSWLTFYFDQGFCVSFLTQVDRSSHIIVENLLQEKLLPHVNARSLLGQPLQKPDLKNETFINFEGYWVSQGNAEPNRASDYVFTSTVKTNLKCLVRIVSAR